MTDSLDENLATYVHCGWLRILSAGSRTECWPVIGQEDGSQDGWGSVAIIVGRQVCAHQTSHVEKCQELLGYFQWCQNQLFSFIFVTILTQLTGEPGYDL